jgi:hypothetical protein
VTALADVIAAAEPALAPHGRPNADGPEVAAGVPDPTRAFVLEAVREGYLLHYAEPRAFEGMDDDLRLLAGDSLYALGLARLAEAGDLEAVAELADLISLTAQAESEGRRDRSDELWRASIDALSGSGGAGARAVARPNRPE